MVMRVRQWMDGIAIEKRAIQAYFRRFGPKAQIPSTDDTLIFEVCGQWYVRLFSMNRVLATYRIVPGTFGSFRLSFVSRAGE